MSVPEEDDWYEYFVKCFASLKLEEFIIYINNLLTFIYTLHNVVLIYPTCIAGSKPSFFSMLPRRSRHASLFVPSVELREKPALSIGFDAIQNLG